MAEVSRFYILQVQLDDQKDCFSWSLSNKTFSVQSMYKDIMKDDGVPQQCITWKVKLPLKIKIFLWYLNKGVILTKDNLVKRRWKGNTSCSFCDTSETIQHLFFDCHMARMVWNAVSITFGFPPPANTNSLFGSWLKSFPFRLRNQILIGAAAVSWASWLSRNEVVLQKSKPNSCLQVIFRATH